MKETGSKKLIMGLLQRMPLEAVQPFFLSLEKAGYQGDLCMIAGGLDQPVQAFLRARGVHLIPFQSHQLKPRYVRMTSWLGKLMSRSSRQLLDSLLASSYMHPFCARHFFYQAYLQECAGTYSHVMLTDVRDVLFQADPFAFDLADGLHVFLADRSRTIGTCAHNTASMLRGFDKKMLAKLHDQPVSCAGTTIGTTAAIREHVGKVTRLLCEIKQRQTVDQAVHNVAIREFRPAQLHIHDNFAGPVLTMAHIDPARMIPDAQGRLLNDDGSIINTLHQYDRHPDLARQLLAALT